MKIAFLNQKGGVGKTTLSVHVAARLSALGLSVLLVDADPQASALAWAGARKLAPLFPVVGIPTAGLHKEIPSHVEHYDAIIIDGPPRVSELARSAIMASDMVIIPAQPSPYDVWAAADIITLLREASVFKESLFYAFVINNKIGNTAIGRDVRDALAAYETPVLNASVCRRVAFADSAADGLVVMDSESEGKATAEIFALTDEILSIAIQEGFYVEKKGGNSPAKRATRTKRG
jgi:chromosome partitioning protein